MFLIQIHPEDGDSKVFRNPGTISQHYTASQPRRPVLTLNKYNCIIIFTYPASFKESLRVACEPLATKLFGISSCETYTHAVTALYLSPPFR